LDKVFPKNILLFVLLFIASLAVHGAIPMLMIPTLGQTIWTMGYAQSLANGSLLGVYAQDIGLPAPAPIAFGLAGAWPSSLLLRVGLAPGNAYTCMLCCWLFVAFYSAYKIGRHADLNSFQSSLGAFFWLSMPIVWGHSEYSMLSLGMALLPFYLRPYLALLQPKALPQTHPAKVMAIALLTTVISVFMDGYTFVMFAVGATCLLVAASILKPQFRHRLIMVCWPIHIVSFGLAYFLYSRFIGKPTFEPHDLNFFRGWGLDLSFVAIPTKGIHWLADLLGVSIQRSDEIYFGDDSVWITTFCLPLIIVGLVAWWCGRTKARVLGPLFLMSLVAFYLSLGPSLKINATKPEDMRARRPASASAMMSAEYATISTGTARIFKYVPGINVMRSTYRWSALGIFGLWALVIFSRQGATPGGRRLWLTSVLGLSAINLPNLPRVWENGVIRRAMVDQIDHDIVARLAAVVPRGATVAFIPAVNDFMATYLAPRAGFRTFNIGGDKNLAMAEQSWPVEMRAMRESISPSALYSGVKMLVTGAADMLIVPYYDPLWSAHFWPCVIDYLPYISYRNMPNRGCIPFGESGVQQALQPIEGLSYVEIHKDTLFAAVRLNPAYRSIERQGALWSEVAKTFSYPVATDRSSSTAPLVLASGWHQLETDRVWSQGNATLTLPIPAYCRASRCVAILRFSAYAASRERPVQVELSTRDGDGRIMRQEIVATSQDLVSLSVPLGGDQPTLTIEIRVPDAISPSKLDRTPDPRVLGIALRQIDLEMSM
jgi:hypothetical protein